MAWALGLPGPWDEFFFLVFIGLYPSATRVYELSNVRTCVRAVIGCFWVGRLSEDDFQLPPFSGFGRLVIIFGWFYLLLSDFFVASSIFCEVTELVSSWGKPLPAADFYVCSESHVYVLFFEVIVCPLVSGTSGSLFVPPVELRDFARMFLHSLLLHSLCPCCLRRVGMLSDVQPRLVFMRTILDASGVVIRFLSLPSPRDVSVLSSCLECGCSFFSLDRVGVSCRCAPLSSDVCSSPSRDRPKWFCSCV